MLTKIYIAGSLLLALAGCGPSDDIAACPHGASICATPIRTVATDCAPSETLTTCCDVAVVGGDYITACVADDGGAS